jgi:hypothetical protein
MMFWSMLARLVHERVMFVSDAPGEGIPAIKSISEASKPLLARLLGIANCVPSNVKIPRLPTTV